VADGWFNAVRFAPDGSVVTVEMSTSVEEVKVVRLGPDGVIAAGWPWRQSNVDLADAATVPDGSTYVIARTAVEISLWKWSLHRLDAHGRETAGFPIKLPAVELCRIVTDPVDPASVAVVACAGQDDTTTLWTTTVTRVGPNGRVAAGWPTRVHGMGSPLGFLSNGDVVLSVSDYDLARSRASVRAVLLRPGGRPDPAWQAVRFSDTSTVLMLSAGVTVVSRVYADGECGAALSTTYRVLGADGLPARGWPVTIKGWGSDPVVRDDESLVVAASGGRVRAWSAAGHTLPGWPLSGIDLAMGCDTGPTPIGTGVGAGPGAVVVVGDKDVTMLGGHGVVVTGWPVELTDSIARTCMSCTPGPAGPISPAANSAGVYVPLYRHSPGDASLNGQPRVLVLDQNGRPATSWDGLIGAPGDELLSLQGAIPGRVWAVVRHPGSSGPRDSLVLVGVELDAN
jgi:hypothetical protein